MLVPLLFHWKILKSCRCVDDFVLLLDNNAKENTEASNHNRSNKKTSNLVQLSYLGSSV